MRSRLTSIALVSSTLLLGACNDDAGVDTQDVGDTGDGDGDTGDGDGDTGDGDGDTGDPNACTLTENTSETSTTNDKGCPVLSRDTSSCEAERMDAGLSGVWLEFSCRVSLSIDGDSVMANADGQPDYGSFYFPETDPCYAAWDEGLHNPNEIAIGNYTLGFPSSANTSATPMMGHAVVGLAVNGVPIYSNFAAPGDDIFLEAMTFDKCDGHPQMQGNYHYHSEPGAITYDDANLVGVLLDGYPIYGRKDADGTYPTLDSHGGHMGVTAESPGTEVYHYHVNEQTSDSPQSMGQMQWFLTTGEWHGAPGSCAGGGC
jgi:hypothetical protein